MMDYNLMSIREFRGDSHFLFDAFINCCHSCTVHMIQIQSWESAAKEHLGFHLNFSLCCCPSINGPDCAFTYMCRATLRGEKEG